MLALKPVSVYSLHMSLRGQIKAACATHQGQRRDHNEDYVRCWEPETEADESQHGWVYIVADGVGGADAGEVASQYATEQALIHYFKDKETHDWGRRLVNAMQAANTDLRQLVAVRNHNRRMATTMVAVVIQNDRAFMANVGDSRGYRWRDGQLKQITKDQSLVAKLLEEGAITAEEAENHPRKNVILSSVGSEKRAQIDLFQITFQPQDILVLCSDGLTRHVSDAEISEIIAKEPPETAVNTLVDLANERGGEDNISVTIVQYDKEKPKETAVSPATNTQTRSTPIMAATGTSDTSVPFLRQYTIMLTFLETALIFYFWYILRP
ncbi:MAG: Stp1/IreP family PP2C-type Ser/Thr phosphatase [Candidatus Thermofonsia bacterium]|nr:MAG: Stp1/IreP family PP2C-type Ser/Thr phosphatase [Candidatus Thermofonsia bacterium]